MKRPRSGKPGPKAKPWAPVPVAAQRKAHRAATAAWKPVPVAAQRKAHQVAVSAKARKGARVRKWSPGWDLACCSAEAVGLLLGLSPEDTLALYWATASDPDEGASILDTLLAARNLLGTLTWENVIYDSRNSRSADWPAFGLLGCALPEPHAVAVTPDGTWWSWGEPFNPADWPQLVIEEAWACRLLPAASPPSSTTSSPSSPPTPPSAPPARRSPSSTAPRPPNSTPSSPSTSG